MKEILRALYLHQQFGAPAPVMVFGEPVPAFTDPSSHESEE